LVCKKYYSDILTKKVVEMLLLLYILNSVPTLIKFFKIGLICTNSQLAGGKCVSISKFFILAAVYYGAKFHAFSFSMCAVAPHQAVSAKLFDGSKKCAKITVRSPSIYYR
jgi:hypothetical protein